MGVFGSRRLRYAETFVVSRPPAISRSHSSGRAFCNCVSIRSTSANVSSMRRHKFNLCARGARLGDSATASLFIHHFQLHFNAMLRGLTWSISWRSPVSICMHGATLSLEDHLWPFQFGAVWRAANVNGDGSLLKSMINIDISSRSPHRHCVHSFCTYLLRMSLQPKTVRLLAMWGFLLDGPGRQWRVLKIFFLQTLTASDVYWLNLENLNLPFSLSLLLAAPKLLVYLKINIWRTS